MKKRNSIMVLVLLSTILGNVEAQIVTQPAKIDKKIFAGFEKCRPSTVLVKTINGLFKNAKPAKKERGLFTYSVNSEIFGIPVSEMSIGVCDDGSRDCGWGAFTRLTLDLPLTTAKKKLYELTKKDFTQALRDQESEATLRPILVEHSSQNRSALACDPGSL